MSTFASRLQEAMNALDIRPADLAKLTGIDKSTISRYLSGKYVPKQKRTDLLAQALHVDPGYLIAGTSDGTDASPAAPQDAPAPLSSDRRKIARIPVLGRVAAGIPIEAIENIEDYEERYISVLEDPHDYFALRIVGHSMEPRIWDGDVVIVHKQDDVDSGQIAVVLVNGDDATVKQLKKSSSGITLIGLNPTVYSPHFYTADEVNHLPVRILGAVCEVRGKI